MTIDANNIGPASDDFQPDRFNSVDPEKAKVRTLELLAENARAERDDALEALAELRDETACLRMDASADRIERAVSQAREVISAVIEMAWSAGLDAGREGTAARDTATAIASNALDDVVEALSAAMRGGA